MQASRRAPRHRSSTSTCSAVPTVRSMSARPTMSRLGCAATTKVVPRTSLPSVDPSPSRTPNSIRHAPPHVAAKPSSKAGQPRRRKRSSREIAQHSMNSRDGVDDLNSPSARAFAKRHFRGPMAGRHVPARRRQLRRRLDRRPGGAPADLRRGTRHPVVAAVLAANFDDAPAVLRAHHAARQEVGWIVNRIGNVGGRVV